MAPRVWMCQVTAFPWIWIFRSVRPSQLGFKFDVSAHPSPDGILDDFDFKFFDNIGTDVTSQFRTGGR